jgi:hypothetical protein
MFQAKKTTTKTKAEEGDLDTSEFVVHPLVQPVSDSVNINPNVDLELIAKTYAPPVILPDTVRETLSAEELERSVFGVTTLLFKTDDNQFIRHELLGSDEGRTEDLCAKVERFGPQYVTHNGGTYVIARLMGTDGQPQ